MSNFTAELQGLIAMWQDRGADANEMVKAMEAEIQKIKEAPKYLSHIDGAGPIDQAAS